jgi:outer membrane usher protein
VSGSRRIRVSLLLGLVCAAAAGQSTELLLAIRLNGKPLSDAQPVWRDGPRYFVTASVFEQGRLVLPAAAPTRVAGMDYYPLDAIAGVQVRLDEPSQTLEIEVPAQAFLATDFDGQGNRIVRPEPVRPGLFLNHEFRSFSGTGDIKVSGLVEGGFFSRLGVLTTQFAEPDLMRGVTPLRLTTQFFHDFPGAMTTLAVGDNVSAASPWARRVFYAGVQYASKFSTQPGFIPTVLPSMSGQVSQPSTVDIYVDNMQRLSRPVEPGPFNIRNIPVISGQGDIRMVVTDILGRQQVITQSYIRSNRTLRKGVQEFTYEGGLIRLGYGVRSNVYSGAFAAANHRRGITDTVTLDGRLEVQPGSGAIGLGTSWAMAGLGVFAGGMAASAGQGRWGRLGYAEFSRNQRTISLTVNLQRATAEFRQVGLGEHEKATRMLLQAQVSKSVWNLGSVAAGYLRRDGRTQDSLRVASGSFNLRLGRGFLTVGGTYSLLSPNVYGVTATFVLPLGERQIASTSASADPSGTMLVTEVNRALGLGPGYGYRVRNTLGNQSRTDAGFTLQTMQGSFGVEATQSGDQTIVQLTERASLVAMGGHLLRSQWLNDSFGVVEVEGGRGVPVYVNNQMLAKTNRSGVALIPWLVPYNQNLFHVDGAKLPMNVNFDLEERTVVPRQRTGVLVEYKRVSAGGATLVLVDENGEPVRRGAVVRWNGAPGAFVVALRGEVFVTGLPYPAELIVEWEGGGCAARIEQPPAETVLPRIGPVICK